MEPEELTLSGFRELDEATKALVDKTIAAHLRKIKSICEDMRNLHITLKPIHQREKSEKYEVHAKLVDKGRVFVSKVTERNLLAAIDSSLDKILHEMG